MREPFHITGKVWTAVETIVVTLTRGENVGRGEGLGVYYHGETPASMIAQIEQVRSAIESGAGRQALIDLLPAGGARNAVDAALWDLESRESARSVAEMAGIGATHPLKTAHTIGAADPKAMAEVAAGLREYSRIKLKLTGAPEDGERVRAVREILPDAWIGIDANQGFTRKTLEALLPGLIDSSVGMVEQPFPIGFDHWLEGWDHPLPIFGDESLIDLPDVEAMPGRFEGINIKLDKCGGLTRGLAIAQRARELGLSVMVGNMSGTSLSMAPAFVLGQLCDVIDLDGPLLLATDRQPAARYHRGTIDMPRALWGDGLASEEGPRHGQSDA